jgi:hypothetical protein
LVAAGGLARRRRSPRGPRRSGLTREEQ